MSSDADTIIRYDGPALAGHEIDVQELAPALLALADMIQLTNRRFNGGTTAMKVTVKADLKQQCFMLHIHLAQSILESAKHLFGTSDYKTAKEIAVALNLIFPAGVGGGVFWIWKNWSRRKGEAGLSQSQMITEQRGGMTIINNFNGDGNVVSVPTSVYELAQDSEMIELGRRVMAPLAQTGYDTLAFYSNGKPVVEIDRDEASNFRHLVRDSPPPAPLAEDDAVHTPIRGRATIITRSDIGSTQWRLKWAARGETVHMPEAWLAEYQSGLIGIPVGSMLDLTIEMTTSLSDPNAAPSYKVLVVHGIIPPPSTEQTRLDV